MVFSDLSRIDERTMAANDDDSNGYPLPWVLLNICEKSTSASAFLPLADDITVA